MTLETIKYEKDGGKWVEVLRKVEDTTEEIRFNVFDSCSFFRAFGGTETNFRKWTGGPFYRNISTSPGRQHRTERIFHW